MELLAKYIEQTRLEVEKITDKKEHYRASIECSIDNAKLFSEAGFLEEARDDLVDTLGIAYQANENNLGNKIQILIDEIDSRINGIK